MTMLAFFHPHNLVGTLIIYAAIAVLAGIVCGCIALYQEWHKRKSAKSETNKIKVKL